MSTSPSAKTAIITRTKGRPLLLVRAIESVLNQADDDFVHVIVNDGGERGELEQLLERFRQHYGERLVVLHNEQSRGMEAASNVGIKASQSKYVVIHDDDDSWATSFLTRTTKCLDAHGAIPHVGGCTSYAMEVQERISESGVVELSRQSMAFPESDLTLWRMCVGNFFPPISFIYRRDVLAKVGLYREDLPVQGDWEFNLRFMQHYEIALLEEALAFYHVRTNKAARQSLYRNSVSSTDKHRFYNRYIRNELLRNDLEAGRFGVGYMVNVNPMFLRLDRINLRLLRVWESIANPLRLVRRRWQ